MLLSRLTGIQPGGEAIVPLPDKRTVTTVIMTSPETASGRAIVSERAFELRAVVCPRRTIGPSVGLDGWETSAVNTGSRNGMPLAGAANAPAKALATRKAVQAASAIRGRLPNISFTSAEQPPRVRFSPLLRTP